jgi:hypothetical protein
VSYPAFPTGPLGLSKEHAGLSKREYFAGQMLAALAISTSHHFQTIMETVECAVDYADALLVELAKPVEGDAK